MTDVNALIIENLDIWTSAVEKKSGAGRGSGGAITLSGIKKLRELILELAVRGKLVPQDLNEGNALELVKQYASEKRRWVKEKQVKSQKVAKDPCKDEQPFDLPETWKWVRLGDLGFIFNGNSVSAGDKSEKYSRPSGLPFIATKDVGYGFEMLNYDVDAWIPEGEPKFKMASAGTTLICSEGGSAGKKCGLTIQPIYFGNKLFACNHYGHFNSKLLLAYYQTPTFYAEFSAKMTGIIGGISLGNFVNIPFPLPPLSEQHRIVAKVDELMELCDTLEAQAESSHKAHQTLVQTCLAALTNSENPEDLAQNWARLETHFDILFTTEESIQLLENAVQELAVFGQLVEQDPSESRANQALLRPDGSAEKFDLEAFEARSKLFQLPEGWTIEPLSRVSSHIVDCPHTTPEWTDEGELCIKSEQIFAGQIDLSKPRYVSHETYIERIERLTPQSDDILYKREGGILGVGSRIPPDTKVCLGQRLMLIRAGEAVRPDYLELVINSPWTRRFAAEKTTGGAAPRVNMTVVRAYPIPVPPMEEQARIVERVQHLVELCGHMKTSVQTESKLRTALADTLVEKAA